MKPILAPFSSKLPPIAQERRDTLQLCVKCNIHVSTDKYNENVWVCCGTYIVVIISHDINQSQILVHLLQHHNTPICQFDHTARLVVI